jgi:cell division protease FtsH
VGVGAARIRETFKKARANAPCIIFIDEIDAIGKERSSSNMGSNSEQEQTMNQILTEMDGFKSHEGVLVIAATNRKEVLDPALVRSGRFDRHVDVPVPSRSERLDILELYAKDKKLSADVDLDLISGWTSGMVGADLKNLLNEAAILSTINDLEEIPQEAIEISLDKLQLGIENNCDMTDQERNVIAYHEAGHALLGALVNEFDTLTRVSIVPRGDAGGITMFQPDEKELQLYSQQYLLNKLIVLLGGRIAEEHAFGKLQTTTGASADLQAVHEIAHTMVSVLGFNETLGPVAWDENVGEIVSNDIDAEIKQIVNWAYRQGKELIEANEFYLKALANALLENDTLYTDDIMIALEGLECPWMKRMEIEDDHGSHGEGEGERDEGEGERDEGEGESEEGGPIPPALVRKLKRLEGDI